MLLCVLSPFGGFAAVRLFILCVFCGCSWLLWVGVFLLVLCVCLGLDKVSFKSGSVMECLSFFIYGHWKIFWIYYSWSLNVCITLDHDLLAFIFSTENLAIILRSLPLYIPWSFFATLNILYLFCMIFMWWGDFFFGSVCFVFCEHLVPS